MSSEEKSNPLFVQEDDEGNNSSPEREESSTHKSINTIREEPEDANVESIEEEDDDPIINSFPIILNTVPSKSQSLHILQYPGRPKTRLLNEGAYKANIKEESNYLEVKVPLDTSKFFNVGKTEDWGEQIGEQGLHGVLNKSEGGLYVGQIINDGGHKKIVLTPVDSTAQLRASFKYIDDVDASNQAQRKAEVAESSKNSNIQILQTAAKSGNQITSTEGFGNALGESLRHIKKFEEEHWATLKWETSTSESAQEIKSSLANSADGIELTTKANLDSYINELTHY
ncbi:DNA-directed RNA polymerase III subunit Rpc5 [Scheffersomyces xylosifermentans]|uniref:DNA-directed RNA polymerase III subunit Rpc5 n=1 Tax=Scheffersomyces xylosifermentans TaxID=1304137 RepID=UPI00315C9497